MRRLLLGAALAAGVCILGSAGDAEASSHREAPFVTKNPKVDSSDFYMFRSYETGRDAYVTLLANYQPLQDSYGGPNYFELDPEALYEVHIDNNGDGDEDITFQFRFHHALQGANGLQLPITLEGTTKTNSVPLLNIGGVTFADTSKLHVLETYDLSVVKGNRRTGAVQVLQNGIKKPADYVGSSTFGSAATYETYAASHVQTFTINGCANPGKVWVGQRREGFAANIGVVFDLIQGPATGPAAGQNGIFSVITGGGTAAGRGFNAVNAFDTGLLYNKNVTTLALEVPIACVKGATDNIGAWTSASMRQARVLNPGATYTVPSKEGGAWTQVSRLGSPLVNEVVIGLKDKDNWNASTPKDTAKFADYVTHPTLAALIEVLYNAAAPTVAKAPSKIRTDLVGAFATGLTVKNTANVDTNINQTSTGPGNPGPAGNTLPAGIYEMLRLNTGIGVKSKAQQVAMGDARGIGALGCFTATRQLDLAAGACDPAGYPNGRRPGDDVVDIALRVVMGVLIGNDTDAPARSVPFTDGNFNGPEQFTDTFPYLRTPLAGNDNPYNPAVK